MSTPLCQLQDVSAGYGLSSVLFGVSLEIQAGECVGLLGRNGVGKTTTMRVICGLNRAESGRVLYQGQEISKLQPDQRARLGIGLVPEDRRIFSDLTVLENLKVAERAGPAGKDWNVERVFELFPDLKPHAARRGGYLSGGQQQMLTIGRTLVSNPRLLLLDEPSEGLAPIIVENLRAQIARLKQSGLTILLAEQSIHFSLALSDRIYVLEKGQVRFSGTPAEFSANPEIQEKYLFV
ncbi:ABC transporter ATP-binding protein [Massilia sp. W12]|uniref:ABC transporter ATP-binding protein n=1 Tax=Massilia sp. W12 TaxID=3126507 RepID=UPI0030CEC499